MPLRILVILLIIGALIAAFFPALVTLLILGVLIAVVLLARNLEFGLILLIFFYPYLGLVIDFSTVESLREIPYLGSINAPFIDLYGLVFFAAWGLRILTSPKYEIRMTNQSQMTKTQNSSLVIRVSSLLPHWKSYFLFWLSGLLSLWRVPSINFATSLKYFLRPFTFFYLVFFAPVVSILTGIRNYESGIRMLHRVLTVFYWTGLISAIDGLLGLFFGAHEAFPRATPFGLFGVNPLGPNHNLLAETLIATAPAGLILMNQESTALAGQAGIRNQGRQWIKYGMWFQWGIALLTFARTAWIAIAVQAGLYLWFGLETKKRGEMIKRVKKVMPIMLLIAVFFAMLIATTFTETVRGSTLSRFDQARIVAFYFDRTPILGQGIGTFIPTLWHTRAYLLEYGDPLEAHGILFKLMFEQGALGLITFMAFLGSILWVIWQAYRKAPGNATLVALFIASGAITYQLFNTTYYTSKLWVPLAVAIALAISKLRTK